MGIIIRQSIKGSIWSYIGVPLGFVTTAYLYPEYLTTEVVGLFGLLISISVITAQLAGLGFNGVTSRLFPYFRDPNSGHHGFLWVNTLVSLAGFLLFIFLYLLLRNVLIEANYEKSRLLADYIYLLIPLTFFTLLFNALDAYNRILYDTVTGIFLQETLQRILLFLVVLLYIWNIFSLNQLIIAYTVAVSLKGIVLLLVLIRRKEIRLRPEYGFIKKKLAREMASVALYSIVGGMGAVLVFNLDKVLINQMLGLANTGVYTIAFYFGALITIPSRPLLKISGSLIAEAWKENDLDKIRIIYYKSCINQFIIAGFLFIGIWSNIDNILTILGPDYAASKWVIFFIGSGYLFDMMTGANAQVIAYSKHYRASLTFIVILIGIMAILFFLLVPHFGIAGAAAGIASALFLNNLMRFLFLWKQYHMQPFNFFFLYIGAFYTGLYFLLKLVPQLPLILDILVRGTLITIVTGLFVLLVPVSPDIQKTAVSIGKRLAAKFRTNGVK